MVTISVSERFAERFRAVANQGIDPEELLLELLAEREAEDAALLAAPLSPEDVDAVNEGQAQFEAGKFISLEEARAGWEARKATSK